MPTVENRISRRKFISGFTLSTLAVLASSNLATHEILNSTLSLEQVEASMRQKAADGIEIEEAYVYDPKTKIQLLHIQGVIGGVRALTDKERKIADRKIYTHFHPQYVKGELAIPTLGLEDMYEAYYDGFLETRATGVNPETGLNYLSRANLGNRMWWPDMPKNNLQRLIDKELYNLQDSGMSELAKYTQAYNTVFLRHAKENNFIYEYLEWK
ncbi:MAG TPA: hypothetical protein VF185_03350 [Patescibacteria group bacterium]